MTGKWIWYFLVPLDCHNSFSCSLLLSRPWLIMIMIRVLMMLTRVVNDKPEWRVRFFANRLQPAKVPAQMVILPEHTALYIYSPKDIMCQADISAHDHDWRCFSSYALRRRSKRRSLHICTWVSLSKKKQHQSTIVKGSQVQAKLCTCPRYRYMIDNTYLDRTTDGLRIEMNSTVSAVVSGCVHDVRALSHPWHKCSAWYSSLTWSRSVSVQIAARPLDRLLRSGGMNMMFTSLTIKLSSRRKRLPVL